MRILGNNAILTLNILGKKHAQSNDTWDQQWLEVKIKVRLEGFQAFFNACIMEDEFKAFISSISKVLDTQKGVIELYTVEESIYLKGEVDYTGNVQWVGTLIYPIGTGSKLNFKFETDFYQLKRIEDNLHRELTF